MSPEQVNRGTHTLKRRWGGGVWNGAAGAEHLCMGCQTDPGAL